MLFLHEIYRCKPYIVAFAPHESYKKTTHLNQGLTEDPPAPDRPPPPPPTFSSSSWDHEVYAVEIIPLGGGYLEEESEPFHSIAPNPAVPQQNNIICQKNKLQIKQDPVMRRADTADKSGKCN